MAAVPVEIRGTLYDLHSRTQRQVYIVGEAARSDLSIGGGPVIPPGGGDGIWGPGDPRPQPPIHIPPVPPDPPEGGGNKPPPPGGGWGYVAEPGYGWAYYPAGGDKPQPLP